MTEAKLAIKQYANHQSLITLYPGITCGGNQLTIIGGPCSVESSDQMQETTKALKQAPVQAIRGGVLNRAHLLMLFREWAKKV